ncbi:hypothetical protein DUI87_22743 [Hirundo rustica rustica]|uniref:Uncharacterized protein n=1 Tax=Hirundo rustica rustica TaxID=333673 RepID=A0A3M0JI98_HIRRU|nr:hypothetical protein DUI87_22743 [Hirundo rustica rustica]
MSSTCPSLTVGSKFPQGGNEGGAKHFHLDIIWQSGTAQAALPTGFPEDKSYQTFLQEHYFNKTTSSGLLPPQFQKKKSKSKSVRIMTDEDVAGPSHPAEETEPEIITRSLSLVNCVTCGGNSPRQTNESILTWLLRIWDAAANDTILDGSEARQLGSLSRDVVIDQGIGEPNKLSVSGGDC